MGNKHSLSSSGERTRSLAEQAVRAAQREYLAEIETQSESGDDSDLDEDDSGNARAAFGKQRGYSVLDDIDVDAKDVVPSEYVYPFENLVFEGGGNKGLAYCGSIRVLEELGIMPQIKRFAGTSAGAMTAALLAVGYNSSDIEGFLSRNLAEVFLDHQCGYCSLLPNLISGYGWNPGNRIFKWFGDTLAVKTNDMDITFKQVLDTFNKELCIVVTNLNQMSTEYCHPKTTPDMPVRVAVRMSMAIPGLFKVPKYKLHEQEDMFVDGGLLCNYPVHCFDGWWLSMKNKDSFIQRLHPLSDLPKLFDRKQRFGEVNKKTLGFLLYADNEEDLLRFQLEKRIGVQLQKPPQTKLAAEKAKTRALQQKADREHRRIVRAVDSFLKTLQRHNVDLNSAIGYDELQAALKDEVIFTKARRRRIFGDVEHDVIMKYLDRDGNGEITYTELMRFMEDTGITLQKRFQGYDRKNVSNLVGFCDALQTTLLTNIKKIYVEDSDIERTVGINTGHVGTNDFELEKADRDFIVERGRISMTTFLRYYVASHKPPKKPAERLASIREGVPLSSPRKDEQDEVFTVADDTGNGTTVGVSDITTEEATTMLLNAY